MTPAQFHAPTMNSENDLDLETERYAVYREQELAIEICCLCKKAEDQLGHLVDMVRKTRLLNKINQQFQKKFCNDYEAAKALRDTFRALEILTNSLAREKDTTPTENSLSARVLHAVLRNISINTIMPFEKATAAERKAMKNGILWLPPIKHLLNIQGALFIWRKTDLELIGERIAHRRTARRSKSRLNGGRLRNAGVWPLLRAALNAGLNMRQLAERLVALGLDRPPRDPLASLGSRAARTRRETKSLSEDLRTMKRLERDFPSAENI